MKEIHRLDESTAKITRQQAIEITKKFLEQHHSISNASADLREGRWFVTMCIGMSKSDTRQVRIDANTGKILDYS